MDLKLAGRVAMVTGGSRGIGKAVATALAREGVDVAIIARDADALNAAASDLSRYGTRVLAITADTTDTSSVTAAVAATVAELGKLDIVVNAAAEPASARSMGGIAALDEDEFLRQIDTKALGYLRVIRAAAPHLISNGWGRIVNVSGVNARQTGSITGSVRNIAVVALTKNLADELGPFGTTVNAVHPGYTWTEGSQRRLTVLAEEQGTTVDELVADLAAGSSSNRCASAEEVADVVAFLASPLSVAINGDSISVDGGRRGSIWY